jgi:hypothetical protein
MLFIQRNKLYYLFIRSKTNNKKPNLKERERERERFYLNLKEETRVIAEYKQKHSTPSKFEGNLKKKNKEKGKCYLYQQLLRVTYIY